MAFVDKKPDDGVTLEEITLSIFVEGQEFELYTCQNLSYDSEQEKELRYGAGYQNKKIRRVLRKTPKYSFSMDLDEPNHALLQKVEDFKGGLGEVTVFLIGGKKYASLLDLPAFTVMKKYPAQDGSTKVVRLIDCEFTKDSASVGVSEAAGRKVEGFATDVTGNI